MWRAYLYWWNDLFVNVISFGCLNKFLHFTLAWYKALACSVTKKDWKKKKAFASITSCKWANIWPPLARVQTCMCANQISQVISVFCLGNISKLATWLRGSFFCGSLVQAYLPVLDLDFITYTNFCCSLVEGK